MHVFCKTSARAAYTRSSNRPPQRWSTQAINNSAPAGAAHQDEQKVGEAVALVDLVHHLFVSGRVWSREREREGELENMQGWGRQAWNRGRHAGLCMRGPVYQACTPGM